MSVEIQWINHASFRLAADDCVVYIDPWKLSSSPADADVVFVSHDHFDHFSADDVAAVSGDATVVVGPVDTVQQLPNGRALEPGQCLELPGAVIEGVPAYNIGKDFHPRHNNWLGAVIEIGGVRVYYAGDTDQIPEMSELSEIDVALLPVGGTYTMNATEAVDACRVIGPKRVLPYHWGDIVGSEDDARAFVDAVSGSAAQLLRPGESLPL